MNKINSNDNKNPDDIERIRALIFPILPDIRANIQAPNMPISWISNMVGISTLSFSPNSFGTIGCCHKHHSQQSHGHKEKAGQVNFQLFHFPNLVKNGAKFLITFQNRILTLYPFAECIFGKPAESDL